MVMEIQNQYPILKENTYLMNASIAGVHKRVHKKISEWNDFVTFKGAIDDIKYGELVIDTLKTISTFINAGQDEVAISISSSLNMNIFALMLKERTTKRKIILPADEFPSSVLAWYHHGFEVIQIESASDGYIDADEIIDACDEEVAAVVHSGVQFLTGFKADLKYLSTELEAQGIDFIVNATQWIGAFPIDMSELKVSAMTCSTHKWLGAGIGSSLVYLSNEFQSRGTLPFAGWFSVKEPWLLKNDPPELRQEASATQLGTMPFGQIAGFNEAMKVQLEIGSDLIANKVLENADYLLEKLKEMPVKINSYHQENHRSGIINFSPLCEIPTCEQIAEKLKTKKIFINTRRGTLRVSPHFFNTKEEIDLLVLELGNLLSKS